MGDCNSVVGIAVGNEDGLWVGPRVGPTTAFGLWACCHLLKTSSMLTRSPFSLVDSGLNSVGLSGEGAFVGEEVGEAGDDNLSWC
jgi:hypothetical protein